MTKTEAFEASMAISAEAKKLAPSALVTFFEIDLTEILFERGVTEVLGSTISNLKQEQSSIFRFHNSISLTASNLVFQGKTYHALPIEAKGFEFSGSGTLPTPKLKLSANEDTSKALSLLRNQISKLGDLTGAKVTRIRTFLRHLDEFNFVGIEKPLNFDPDVTKEFPRDVYYIDRKTAENKMVLEYQLASILDVEGKRLPGRLVFAGKCTFCYRGKGCGYEFANNKISGESRLSSLHDGLNAGGAGDKYYGRAGYAPPVATVNDETFDEILGVNYQNLSETELQSYDKGLYEPGRAYAQAEYVYISKSGVNYYFVAKTAVPKNFGPPNEGFWILDQCSQTERGCASRFGKSEKQADGTFKAKRELPFGGFPGANRLGART
jgi:lambda family phage minor tail protein L